MLREFSNNILGKGTMSNHGLAAKEWTPVFFTKSHRMPKGWTTNSWPCLTQLKT
jgi:hypothetical protein